MKECGYYPVGSEFDPRAPWNETAEAEPVPVEKEAEYTCVMRCSAPVYTSDYEWGWNHDDFSDTDWLHEWKRQHLTPSQLIGILASIAGDLASGRVPERKSSKWKEILADCRGWQVDDEEAEERY